MRLILPLAALVIGAASLSAQQAPPPQGVPTAADSARGALAVARSDLRNLVVAQEAYFADHGRYAPTMEALDRYRPSRGNVIKLVHVVNDGWTASLTGAYLPGSCTIWVNVPSEKRAGTEREKRVGGEGEPVCDTPPALAPPSAARP